MVARIYNPNSWRVGDRKDKKLMVSLNYILSLRPFWVIRKEERKEANKQESS